MDENVAFWKLSEILVSCVCIRNYYKAATIWVLGRNINPSHLCGYSSLGVYKNAVVDIVPTSSSKICNPKIDDGIHEDLMFFTLLWLGLACCTGIR